MLPTEVRAQRLSDLIRRPISSRLIQYVAQQASAVIPCHSFPPPPLPPPTSRTHHHHQMQEETAGSLPTLPVFIQSLIKRSCVKPGTILGALVFLDRLKRRLAHLAKGMPCTCHRIFLATLIVTSKSLHDTSPKNKHWARYAVHFNLSEINLMEQQLLSLMNYQLIITPEEIDHAFVQYELYKAQHQRHHVLPTPAGLSTSAPLLVKDHPLLQHAPAGPPSNLYTTACLNQSTVSLPKPMEPRHVDGNLLNTRLGKPYDSIPDETSSSSSSCAYPAARLFPISSLSSSSISSGSSTSLRTPSSSTSLNMISSSLSSSSSLTLQTPLTSLNLTSTDTLCSVDSALDQQQQQQLVDVDPVLFYPPAHVRDSYRSSSHPWHSLWHQQLLPPVSKSTTEIPFDPDLERQRLWPSKNEN